MNYFLKATFSALFLLALIIPAIFIAQNKVKPSTQPAITPVPQEEILGQTRQRPDYLIVLVGDSMTDYLGNSDELRKYIGQYYQDKTFDFLNYGFGSTNILSVPNRLTEWTFYGRDFQPIMDIDFDLILVESFGHNPLSDFPLEEGLKKQSEALDKIIGIITQKQPKNKIVFVATLAPNSKKYASGVVEMDQKTRDVWVSERRAYIKNHIKYAQNHGIPIINIFAKSQDKNGDGKIEFVESQNYIHPSPEGIRFISHEIADFIYKNKLLN